MSTMNTDNQIVDFDLSPQEFRKLGYRVIDMIADYYYELRDTQVFPPHTSAELEKVFEEQLPEKRQDPEEILNEWQYKVLPNSTNLGSPRYFGFVNGSGTMIGTLAEALAASVNIHVGSWKLGPAATEIERRVISWMAEMIGYSPACGGLLTSGGTMASFTAIETALRNLAPYDTTNDGLQSKETSGRFTIYMSDHEGHISITRVADLLNLGRNAVRFVASRSDFTMDVQDLERKLDEDIAKGDNPLCVVAQVGSINVGAVDPLDDIARICQERGLWLHADGACGAFGAMLPEKKSLFKGLEKADSITLDPHKWLYIPYECGCVLVQDPEKLRRAFSMSAPYLRGILPTEYTGLDYFEYGPQMSRGFRALKVWMSIKHYGMDGYCKLLGQNLKCVEYLDKLVRASPEFEALHAPTLFIYSFRYAPVALRKKSMESNTAAEEIHAYLDRLNQQIADQIQLSGVAFVTTTRVRGRVVLRLSICSHRTTFDDINLVFAKIVELGESLQLEI